MRGAGPIGSRTGEGAEVLRAKYLDYCSAQLAELLLYLSPDEIFLLAQRSTRDVGGSADVSYARMVQGATRWLSERVPLPPFDVWVADYQANPDRYEEYFMGLWESELRSAVEG